MVPLALILLSPQPGESFSGQVAVQCVECCDPTAGPCPPDAPRCSALCEGPMLQINDRYQCLQTAQIAAGRLYTAYDGSTGQSVTDVCPSHCGNAATIDASCRSCCLLTPAPPYYPGCQHPDVWCFDSMGGLEGRSEAPDGCPWETADATTPRVECPPISVGCGAVLGYPPQAGGVCFADTYPLVAECHLGDGTPWTTSGVDPAGNTSYSCVARSPQSAGTSSCEGSIHTVASDDRLTVTTTPMRRLWPPNHGYEVIAIGRDCGLTAALESSCGGGSGTNVLDQLTYEVVRVSSSQPEDSAGDGDGRTLNDAVICPDGTVRVRAERDGAVEDGRVYSIDFIAHLHDLTSEVKTCAVMVPRSSGSSVPVTGLRAYTQTGLSPASSLVCAPAH